MNNERFFQSGIKFKDKYGYGWFYLVLWQFQPSWFYFIFIQNDTQACTSSRSGNISVDKSVAYLD